MVKDINQDFLCPKMFDNINLVILLKTLNLKNQNEFFKHFITLLIKNHLIFSFLDFTKNYFKFLDFQNLTRNLNRLKLFNDLFIFLFLFLEFLLEHMSLKYHLISLSNSQFLYFCVISCYKMYFPL